MSTGDFLLMWGSLGAGSTYFGHPWIAEIPPRQGTGGGEPENYEFLARPEGTV